MGSPKTEAESYDEERPQYQVTIEPFFIGKYLVTQVQWQVVAALSKVDRDLNPNPSYFKGDNRPVECICWYDAVEFCKRLSQTTGRDYRLPSEVEWEYACRAGTTTPFHFGETITTELANYNGNYIYSNGFKGEYRKQTTPVGYFPANAFGLYDMHGNVWEWCTDTLHRNYEGAPRDGSAWLEDDNTYNQMRLLRGGSWHSYPGKCRSAYRYWSPSKHSCFNIGFRVVSVQPFLVSQDS
jgi:formylglycine-generating enzyme required for sulfatase activity